MLPPKKPHEQFGSVIVWARDVDENALDQLITAMRSCGLIEDVDTQAFNPEHGSPVFYTP